MRRLGIALLLLVSIDVLAAGGRRRAVSHPGGPVPPPVAAADAYMVAAGTALTVSAPGVLANDTVNRASLVSFGPSAGTEQTALGSSAQTAHGGSLSVAADGGFTYTPASGFAGTDTFKYVIRNGGGSSPATVTITVAASAQANAVSDSYNVTPEGTLSVPAPGVLANDTLAGGRIISFGPFSGSEQTILGGNAATSQGGATALHQDGSLLYTTPPSVDDGYGTIRPFTGVDSFSYVIQSGSSTSAATVNVFVAEESSEADFVVTTPGHYYAIEGFDGENPVLRLKRGQRYVFEIRASSLHPFAIEDAPEGSVTNNNVSRGLVTFKVPMAAQNYRYRCTTHGFGNVIETVP